MFVSCAAVNMDVVVDIGYALHEINYNKSCKQQIKLNMILKKK
jgi:hypothetical protein